MTATDAYEQAGYKRSDGRKPERAMQPKGQFVFCHNGSHRTELEARMTNSSIADRMRRYRDRRNKKLRCLTIEIRDSEIDALVQRGLLNPETRNDIIAITKALHSFLDQVLN